MNISIERQAKLILDTRTKVPSSLGGMEYAVIRICGILNTLQPEIRRPTLVLAASDHGIANDGVTLSPGVVTEQMMHLFSRGNGSCALLCKANDVNLDLVDCGMSKTLQISPAEDWITYETSKVRLSDGDFSKGQSLTEDEVSRTLRNGREKAADLNRRGCNTIVLGEMGIGNTTVSGAIASALTGLDARLCLMRGSADPATMKRKIELVNKAVAKLPDRSPMTVMTAIGGLEIIYLAGVVLGAKDHGMLVLNDGFITTSAVLLASSVDEKAKDCVLCCHNAGESHSSILDHLGLETVLSANMHLGEGTGALASLKMIRDGLHLYGNLESFTASGVDGSLSEKRLPFALGTSSYILNADILPNIEYLKDKVSDVELVLFESRDASNIPGSEVVSELGRYAREWDLTYTVHLPYDVKAGSFDEKERLHAVDTWVRVIDLTKVLPVHGFIVHLEPERYRNDDGTPCPQPSSDTPRWTTQISRSMAELKERTGAMVDPSLICIETLSYDIMPYLPAILSNGFSLTLDIGHLWLNGYCSADYVKALLPHTRIVHLHGVNGLRDHQSLDVMDRTRLASFLEILRGYEYRNIVVTLEVFSEDDLRTSLSLLHEMEAF